MRKPYGPTSILFTCLSLLLIAFGCSDDDGGTTNPPPADTDPPQIAFVSAVNMNQIKLTFNEKVDKTTAEDADNYTVVDASQGLASPPDAAVPAAPGDTLNILTVAQTSSSVVLMTLWDSMNASPFAVFVVGVEDLNGNAITSPDSTMFSGSTVPDETGPELLRVAPANGTNDVGIGESMAAQFDEPVNLQSAFEAFTFRTGGNVTAVSILPREPNVLFIKPVQLMPGGTTCTARFSTALTDWFGNSLDMEKFWTFNTDSEVDGTPPTLVSTTPADGATQVPLDVVMQLRFSEAIDPASLNDESSSTSISLNPPVYGEDEMSTDGTTLTFTPDDPLAANTSYTLVVPTGSVRDRAGNLLKGSTTVQFTTADEFPSGEISGVVSGHVGTQAANPEGAIAVAPTRTPFVESEEDDLPINGTDVVDATGAYSITRLPDGWYFPFAIMDSNNDGTLDPERGDAIGAYGADIAQGDFEVDSVDVVTIPPSPPSLSVDFPLFDPVAIAGTASYVGTAYKDSLVEINFYVGVFDTAGFDPVNPTPLYQTSSEIAFMPRFALSTLNDAGLMPGTYYVGGFMDTWPPGHDPNDPAVWWGGFPPVPVTIEGGADRLDINLTFTDTSMGGGGNSPVMWVQDKSLARGKDNEAKARFMAYASRIAEQLNRRK